MTRLLISKEWKVAIGEEQRGQGEITGIDLPDKEADLFSAWLSAWAAKDADTRGREIWASDPAAAVLLFRNLAPLLDELELDEQISQLLSLAPSDELAKEFAHWIDRGEEEGRRMLNFLLLAGDETASRAVDTLWEKHPKQAQQILDDFIEDAQDPSIIDLLAKPGINLG